MRKVDKLVHLTVNGEEIITTVDHPFYVNGQGFVHAVDLCIGSELVDSAGSILKVEQIFREKLQDETCDVYNFKVDEWHTYFVGDRGVLVHNADRSYSSTAEVENALKDMEPCERVATVKTEAKAIAEEYGFIKNKKISIKNNRDVYENPNTNTNTKGLYSLDTQHGRFEHCNKRGKHLGEVDFDLNETKGADKSGQHDLIVK